MKKFCKKFIESSKLFFALTGLLAVFVGHNYITKKPNISIERYDPFVSVEMRLFYDLLRTRGGHEFDKVHSIEKIFQELKVPLYDDSQDPRGRYIIFPLETKRNKNFIKMWNKKSKEYQSKAKRLSEEEMQKNHYEGGLIQAGYEEYPKLSLNSSWYLENIGDPKMFFEFLNIPVPEKYENERENYYDNVFLYKDNYIEDIFKEALYKIDDINLKNDFLDSFNSRSRQLWTPFIIKNKGNVIAKDIQIVFQASNVSRIHELIYTNLNHQGIKYFETKDTNGPMYIPNTKNNILEIPFLKPDEVKIVVIKSVSLIPGDEILQVKNYVGEEKNKTVISWLLTIFLIFSIIYFIALLLEPKSVDVRDN